MTGGMPHVTFRKANPDDGTAMLEVHRAAIDAIDDQFYSHEHRESRAFGLTCDGYGRRMAEGEYLELAISRNGPVLGFCGIKNGEIFGLYVHPKGQGQGLGRQLLERGEARLASQGHAVLPLTASLNAQAFYERQGYRLVEMGQVKSRGGLMQVVARMTKTLPTWMKTT